MARLLAALNTEGETHLVIGSSPLASSRIAGSLASGASVVFVTNAESDVAAKSVQEKLQNHPQIANLRVIDRKFETRDLGILGRDETGGVVDLVFVTFNDGNSEISATNITEIYSECRKLRIPINVADTPSMCSFTLLSTHTAGDFQLGVTTSGKGCRLAARIKREAVASLPPNMDAICRRVGELRDCIRREDGAGPEEAGGDEEDAQQGAKFNALVREDAETAEQKKQQRMRWLSQIVEYYPLSKLADVSLEHLSKSYRPDASRELCELPQTQERKRGTISLVGAGPGSVSLLTVGALQEILTADVILADKLVPSQVLELIPRRTTVFIARKFPGNAERAQEELLSMGLEALHKGLKVVRLKQGDPYVYGRGAEEFNFFSGHGFQPVVLAGITSALSAPLLADIPVTHREVTDQVLICTGTGRKGVLPDIPEYKRNRTTVFLMALHRIGELVAQLQAHGWDMDVPCVVSERASSPDQRVIRTTLRHLLAAVEENGSRPPGLLIVGWSCNVIRTLSEGQKWVVEEGHEHEVQAGVFSHVVDAVKKQEE